MKNITLRRLLIILIDILVQTRRVSWRHKYIKLERIIFANFLFTQEARFYVKVNLSFCTAWGHGSTHSKTSVLDVGETSASHLGRFNHGNPLCSSLGGPRRRCGTFGEDKNPLLLSGFESRGNQPLAESLHCVCYLESSHIISIVCVCTLKAEDGHRTQDNGDWI